MQWTPLLKFEDKKIPYGRDARNFLAQALLALLEKMGKQRDRWRWGNLKREKSLDGSFLIS